MQRTGSNRCSYLHETETTLVRKISCQIQGFYFTVYLGGISKSTSHLSAPTREGESDNDISK